MATAEELLAASTGATEPVEEILVADPETRVISIPATIKNLGVESDDDVKHLQFKVPRHYGKIDLSTFKVQINFKNSRGGGDFYPIKDFDSVDDEFITFTWVVDRSAFKYKGDVKFSICMKLYDNAGVVVKEWNTTYATLPVLEGLETQDEIVESNPSAFDQVLYRLYAVEAATGLGQDGYYTVVKVYESDRGVEFEVIDKDGMTVASIRHGGTYIPDYDPSTGMLSWSNDWDLPNPEPVSICGPKGDKGDRGAPGKDGKAAPILYLDSPFTVYDLPQETTLKQWYYDSETHEVTSADLEGCSPITKCPKYLGWKIEGSNTRLYLYIGDHDPEIDDVNFDWAVDGRIEEYDVPFGIFARNTTSGLYNYMAAANSRVVDLSGYPVAYFYYKVVNADGEDNKVTIIGFDEFPGTESDDLAVVPNWITNSGSPQIENSSNSSYYSVVLPTDSYYVIMHNHTSILHTDYVHNLFNVSYEADDGDVHVTSGASFGYIPSNAGPALLRIPSDCPLSDLTIYTSKPVKSNLNSGRRRLAKEIGKDAINKFAFKSQKDILWNDSKRRMETGRPFYGVPYSSRWFNSHFVGFEVSPETALNALNDPYSIAYDGGAKTYTKDETTGEITRTYFDPVNTNENGINSEISDDGGPGYGLVCSAFALLMNGNPYPQTNRGFTFDSGFSIEKTTDINAGMLMINRGMTHVVMVDEVYDHGYSLLEATDPCVAKTVHTGNLEKSSYANSVTNAKFLDDYVYSVKNCDIDGYDKNFTNFDVEVTESSVCPWRGHKAVYGPWDKTKRGSGIGVTFKDGVTVAKLYLPGKNPDNDPGIDLSNASGVHYLDISEYVTIGGTYTIIPGDGSAESYFRYWNRDDVVLNFDADGKAYFSDDDVEYVYVEVEGYGGEFGKYTAADFGKTEDEFQKTGPMVIAKGKCYPDLAKHPSRILDVRAAIVPDPTMNDCWGRYSVPASFGKSYYRNNDDEIARTKADAIVGEASGEIIAIDDSSYDPIMALKLYGKTDQVTTTGKQLLNNTRDTYTGSGITFTSNDDGSITISGTSVAEAYYLFDQYNDIPITETELIASISGSNDVSLIIGYYTDIATETFVNDIATVNSTKPVTLKFPAEAVATRIFLGITTGKTINATVYPMLRLATIEDDSYEPYSGGKAAPNPDYPQELESVENPTVGIYGKNLFVLKGSTTTHNGVTFTVNGDGTVTANGTATDLAYVDFVYSLTKGSYHFSGCPAGGNTVSGYFIRLLANGATVYDDAGQGFDFTLKENAQIIVRLVARVNTVMNNVVFNPMIRAATFDNAFEEGKDPQSLSLARTISGIPVTSGGNYTDSNGQQWICDEVDFERGVYVQRVGRLTVDNSMTYFYNIDNYFLHTAGGDFSNVASWETRIMSTHFRQVGNGLDMHGYGWFQFGGNGGIRFKMEGVDTVAALTEWLNENTPVVIYPLVTPVETKLTAHELTLYRVLSTNHPSTTILNDAGAWMNVKYNADLKTWLMKYIANVVGVIENGAY